MHGLRAGTDEPELGGGTQAGPALKTQPSPVLAPASARGTSRWTRCACLTAAHGCAHGAWSGARVWGACGGRRLRGRSGPGHGAWGWDSCFPSGPGQGADGHSRHSLRHFSSWGAPSPWEEGAGMGRGPRESQLQQRPWLAGVGV